MSDRIQVIICSVLLVAICAWAYYFQFEYPTLLAEFDFVAEHLWQEPWRLLTAHFLHLNALHWIFNGAALLLITFFFSSYFNVRTYLNALIVITIGSTLTLGVLGYEHHFVGLSLLNHGLLVMGLILELQAAASTTQRKIVFIALLVVAAKWFFEFLGIWQSVLAAEQVQYVWQLHGLGILFGILAAWLHNRRIAKLAQLEND